MGYLEIPTLLTDLPEVSISVNVNKTRTHTVQILIRFKQAMEFFIMKSLHKENKNIRRVCADNVKLNNFDILRR